jgi:hypothetical protein
MGTGTGSSTGARKRRGGGAAAAVSACFCVAAALRSCCAFHAPAGFAPCTPRRMLCKAAAGEDNPTPPVSEPSSGTAGGDLKAKKSEEDEKLERWMASVGLEDIFKKSTVDGEELDNEDAELVSLSPDSQSKIDEVRMICPRLQLFFGPARKMLDFAERSPSRTVFSQWKAIWSLKQSLGNDFWRIFDPKNPFIGEL